jgi:hypothetical protein
MQLSRWNRAAGLLVVILSLVDPRAAAAQAGRDTVYLLNPNLRIGFDASHGRLVELTDGASGQRFVTAEPVDVWLLDLPGGADAIGARDAGKFSFAHRANDPRTLSLIWSNFERAPALRVRIDVSLRGDSAISDWRIAFDSAPPIENVRFPRVAGIPPLGPGEELAVPRWMGAVASDPRSLLAGEDGRARRLEWSYPGTMSLQLIALYRRDGPGLYAASDDTLSYRKAFALWGDTSGLGYELIHPLENPDAGKADWIMPYAAVLGTFHGDWFSAAERYRSWGEQQHWARESRLRNGLVPPWLTDVGMWVWNRGRSPGVIPPALALKDALGLPVGVYWHWWHHGPYDTSFPDYLPPREGVDAFRSAVSDAHAAGLHAMVYMNQRLWCLNTPSWTAENAVVAAVKERDGKVREEVYNIFDPKPCATMDVTTPFWRAKYAGIADTVLTQYGIDGIYMDQAVQSLVCWDPTHDHPLGGGNYWMQGFRKLAAGIREKSGRQRPVLLAGEGAGEPWLPELDLMLTLQVSQERYSDPNSGWDPIPFFQAVYHPYAVTYGNYSSLVMPPYDELWPVETAPTEPLALLDQRFSNQFRLEQARAFVWGLQPTIANFRPEQLRDRPDETAYMMRLARLRARTPEYFIHGTFLRAPELTVPNVEIDLSRLSIYAAQRGGPRSSRKRYPAAIAGAWRASDGRVAVAVASIVAAPIEVAFDFDPHVYGLTSGTIERLDDGGRTSLGNFKRNVAPITLKVPPGGAVVIEFHSTQSRGVPL